VQDGVFNPAAVEIDGQEAFDRFLAGEFLIVLRVGEPQEIP
jgi:hypothetical protein